MNIPGLLKSNVQEGKAILMLGAGASATATNDKREKAPCSKELSKLLSEQFLDGNFADYPLSQVAELAMSESDLVTVQEYIRSVFEQFEPTVGHNLLCKFNWNGLATTNYDRLVEKAYSKTEDALQTIVPFIDNSDRVEDRLRDPRALQYLKLHGCITRTNDKRAPLILSTDQLLQYREGRSRIFNIFQEWCYEHIVVFVGYKIQDQSLRAVLSEVEREIQSRPKYYIVVPDAPDPIRRFWEKKNIDLLEGEFEQFMTELDSQIASPFRAIRIKQPIEGMAISERFIKKDIALSEETRNFLDTEVEYVKGAKCDVQIDPRNFYKGMDLGWVPIMQNLDVRRSLSDLILSDHIIDKRDQLDGLRFIVVKAHAGAGKRTLLRRVAWDAANDYNCLCLYLKGYGRISSAALRQILDLTEERVFLFVDDAPGRVGALLNATRILQEGSSLTIITTARTNEWNVTCSELSKYTTSEYELKYLSHKDVDNLLLLLEKHGALGTLEKLSTEARRDALTERAGRQLLVALHEATLGKSFVEIIRDEYQKIRPIEAQRIYESICLLNRFNVPVRAGVISRIHGISFEDFRKRFFAPLELIVNAKYNPIIRDYEYTARHSHIAEIIFEDILFAPEERFDRYIKCLKSLNISYESDRKAFRRMIRANEILDVFSDLSMAKEIYRVAERHIGEDPELLHQMAIYEMKRTDGDLRQADKLLKRAHDIAPGDETIVHSIAELKFHLAENAAHTPLEFDKYVREVETICLSKNLTVDPYRMSTLIKTELLKLKRAIDAPETSDVGLEDAVKHVEEHLVIGKQSYPNDPHLYDLEAKFAKLLRDSERTLYALNRSFKANPRNIYVALRLSRCYQETGDLGKSCEILEKAIEAKPNKSELHYEYVKLLLDIPSTPPDVLEYHFRRSYSPGDRNYDAKLLHARQLHINGDHIKSREIFSSLRYARLPFEIRHRASYPMQEIFHGEVNLMEATYCFIRRDGISDMIYYHQDIDETSFFDNIIRGMRVKFQLAFNMYGPVAINVSGE